MRPARKIESTDRMDLRQLFADMAETMQVEEGVGLAAPQVGLGIRFMTTRRSTDGQVRGFVNPQIVEFSTEREVSTEGCLSFPGQFAYVERAQWIRLRYQDLDLEPQEELIAGYDARVIQHEVDHLNGICIVNRALDGMYTAEAEAAETDTEEEASSMVSFQAYDDEDEDDVEDEDELEGFEVEEDDLEDVEEEDVEEDDEEEDFDTDDLDDDDDEDDDDEDDDEDDDDDEEDEDDEDDDEEDEEDDFDDGEDEMRNAASPRWRAGAH